MVIGLCLIGIIACNGLIVILLNRAANVREKDSQASPNVYRFYPVRGQIYNEVV